MQCISQIVITKCLNTIQLFHSKVLIYSIHRRWVNSPIMLKIDPSSLCEYVYTITLYENHAVYVTMVPMVRVTYLGQTGRGIPV